MSPYVEPAAGFPGGEPIWYDLVANVTHEAVRTGKGDDTEGEEEGKVWRVQLVDKARGEFWVQVQDLFVEEVRKEILFLGETVCMVWERRREGKPGGGKGKGKSNVRSTR
jgi:U4/U6.U5 tri-snRNP-associated protein 2